MIATALLIAAVSLQPCEVREVAARCGKVTVPENREVRGGRTIDLNVVVVPAAAQRRQDALFIIAGGPGMPATRMISWAARTFAAAERDIVLVDARGTGESNPLRCPAPGGDGDLQGYFSDLFDPARIAACREELSARADLTRYTTGDVADDLDHVRRALGYSRMSVFGTSYGTRVAQELMRRHPRSLRAVVMKGVVPPSFAMPAGYGANAERSLAAVFALCRADVACREAYPELEAEYAAVMRAAEKGLETELLDRKTGEKATVTIGRGLFGETFRNFLYSPEAYVRLPRAIHAAAAGDRRELADMAFRYARASRGIDLGFFLSVTCAEDLPRVDERRERVAASNTFLGTYRLDQQIGACRVWPRAKVSRALARPVRSSIPTLLVSGELDPVTPPKNAEEVARTLTRAVHVVVPAGGHSGDTGGCLDGVMSEFIRNADPATLDTGCVSRVPRPQFELPGD